MCGVMAWSARPVGTLAARERIDAPVPRSEARRASAAPASAPASASVPAPASESVPVPTSQSAPAPAAARAPQAVWTMQASGVTVRLRGVSAVSARVAWASGADGTILRTLDGGATWQRRPVPGAEALDFRDIDAFDERIAYALSIGPGDASRIYKTIDGGASWQPPFVNTDPKAFLDAMAFWSPERGVAISDAVDGGHVILQTRDGGRAWARVPSSGLPPALPGEGAFAASGTNVATWGRDHVWIATNAPGADPVAGTSRVLRSSDGGRTWAVSTTPLPAGPSAGIFSIAFRDARHGVIVGGDYKKEGEAVDNAAVTTDGGATWTLVRRAQGLSGFRSVVAWLPRAASASPSSASARPASSGSGNSRSGSPGSASAGSGIAGSGNSGSSSARSSSAASGAASASAGTGSSSWLAVGPSGADESTDDGRTWHPLSVNGPGFHAFSLSRDGAAGWAVGEQGRVARVSPPSHVPNAPR